MPGKTTYYSRIHVLLARAGSRGWRNSGDLIQSVVEKSPENFVYHRWSEEEGEITAHCSIPAVRKTFDLAVDLGLIDVDTGHLTEVGKEAADPGSYDRVLRRRLRARFRQLGIPVDHIESASRGMLRSTEITLPTGQQLYSRVCEANGIQITDARFRTLLRLLGSCGGIMLSRRHIFLPSNTK